MEVCDWNPKEKRAAFYLEGAGAHSEATDGCQNEAILCVGSKTVWHLCESCAKLPEFKKYRKRKHIRN